MNYGYFDSEKKEYVITRPDTPAPWANYLGSPEYGAIISNNAGGYSFIKSGANGRIIRYHFNSDDKPGRYIYIRDNDKSDYWSTSWQPVAKDLKKYKCVCRHGTAYTEMTANYDGISSDVNYFVPLGARYEVWNVKLTNKSKTAKNLSVFGFAEFTIHSNYEQDGINLQYTQYISRTQFKNNKVIQISNINAPDDGNIKKKFLGLVGSEVTGYDGNLKNFIGNYHTYANPICVENGKCTNSENYNGNPCGALKTDITLKSNETKEFSFILGEYNASSQKTLKEYENDKKANEELEKLKHYWHSKLEGLQVKTPDKNFDEMVNTWNAYNCFITFIWSRAASFSYCGLRNGYGYRDTVQDIQGVIHLDPVLAKEKLSFMISAQAKNGGGLPLVKFNHNAGHEDTPDEQSYREETGEPEYRSDDALWLFPTVNSYIGESGDKGFIEEVIPFANGDEGSVYEHLKRAINFSMERVGKDKLPAGLHADWNDCLRMGSKGESTFVAFQLYLAMKILKVYAEDKKDTEYIKYLEDSMAELKSTIDTVCFDKDRYIRGIRDTGEKVGARSDKEANMWLNPQSFAIMSGVADSKKAKIIMDSVEKNLNTDYGAILLNPAYKKEAFDGARMVLFNPGTKENAGVFSQSQGWLILAESMIGEGDRAYKYYCESNPALMNDKAETRVAEPYIYCQFTEGKESEFQGRSNVHWLTGTASTMMVASTQGILGIKPTLNSITVEPCIPKAWESLEIKKLWRGKTLNIKVNNKNHIEKGVKKVSVNGEAIDGIAIPEKILKKVNAIIIDM